MDIQSYIAYDKELLLHLNGSDSLFGDGFMWVATSTYIWIPLGIMLLYVVIKNNLPKEIIWTLIAIVLVITCADQISSGICKPFFARFRPTQDPEIMYMVDIVNNYRGGRYGFISSHAANTFGIAVFVSLLIKNRLLTCILLLWAALNAYSRIYLGVHYPGDIIFGTIVGCMVGWIIYIFHQFIRKRLYSPNRYISKQYTTSGYLINDVYLLINTFIFSCLIIIIWGIIITHILYL